MGLAYKRAALAFSISASVQQVFGHSVFCDCITAGLLGYEGDRWSLCVKYFVIFRGQCVNDVLNLATRNSSCQVYS